MSEAMKEITGSKGRDVYKFCYNATDINVFVLVRLQNCQRAKSARRLSPQGGDVIDENGEKARGLDLQNIRPSPFFFV